MPDKDDDYQKVNQEIEKLESILPGGFFLSTKPEWKSIWNQIRATGASFKGVRFPSHAEHQQAWDRFQELVNEVKRAQEEEQKQWQTKTEDSSKYKDEIIHQAELARLSDPSADMLIGLATGGVSLVLSSLMGPFDERKRELEECSTQLKKGWDLLNEYKDKMLPRDRSEAYRVLMEVKEQLDSAWDHYKRERQQAFEDFRAEKEQKHQEWKQRIQENIDKLESRKDRLTEIIEHKESHLAELHDKLSDAWNDDFVDRVNGWISEEEDKLDSLRSQLSQVEEWLNEARNRLNT